MSTLYASFADPSAAERAAGALLDHGARPADLTILADERHIPPKYRDHGHAERAAKEGISTTTAKDAAIGATKGAAAGLGVGVAAVLASLVVPGFGIVIGGGALATAIAAGTATVAAGAAAGGVAGYLKDQGVPENVVTHYSTTFREGGAILAIDVPTGDLEATEAEAILAKYHALNIATYNRPKTILTDAVEAPQSPMVMQGTGSIPPVVVVEDRTTLTPTNEVILDDSGAAHQTVGHSTLVDEEPAVEIDPEGKPHAARIVEEQRAVVTEPVEVDALGNKKRTSGPVRTSVIREKHVEVEE